MLQAYSLHQLQSFQSSETNVSSTPTSSLRGPQKWEATLCLSVGADHFKMVSALALFLYKMETNSSRQYQTH